MKIVFKGYVPRTLKEVVDQWQEAFDCILAHNIIVDEHPLTTTLIINDSTQELFFILTFFSFLTDVNTTTAVNLQQYEYTII
jgi:hypothetical protein